MNVDLYDNLADSYDLLISWKRRLRRERPFFTRLFKQYGVCRVLDTASGTGMHAIAFHNWGYHVTGVDISEPMVEKSRENARSLPIEFAQAGFDELDKVGGLFDAVTCLGNSLPHVLTDEDLEKSLRCIYDALLPGGILVIHGNNYDRIVGRQERFMPLANARHQGRDYLFMRFFDFKGDLLTFNVITMSKKSGEWQMYPDSSTHRALTHNLLTGMLEKVGFQCMEAYGSFAGEEFVKLESDNLIVVAQKAHNRASLNTSEPVTQIDRVPVLDNGDPLVNVEDIIPGVTVKHPPIHARKTVAEMLLKARESLPEGYNFQVRAGFRSWERQNTIYNEFYQKLQGQHPQWPKSQLRREANKFLAPPDAKHPPGHSTGGAIDLTIIGPDGNELDMSSTIKAADHGMATFVTYTKLITPKAAKNRQLLFDAMTGAGFSNYPGEWWHFSYGDSAWAVRVSAPHALYAAAKPPITE